MWTDRRIRVSGTLEVDVATPREMIIAVLLLLFKKFKMHILPSDLLYEIFPFQSLALIQLSILQLHQSFRVTI